MWVADLKHLPPLFAGHWQGAGCHSVTWYSTALARISRPQANRMWRLRQSCKLPAWYLKTRPHVHSEPTINTGNENLLIVAFEEIFASSLGNYYTSWMKTVNGYSDISMATGDKGHRLYQISSRESLNKQKETYKIVTATNPGERRKLYFQNSHANWSGMYKKEVGI